MTPFESYGHDEEPSAGRVTSEAARTLLVGGVASDELAVEEISAQNFVRSQLDGRFGHIILGRDVSALNTAAQRLVIHNCAAHLLPGGTLVLALPADALSAHLGSTGFTAVHGGGEGSVWRRADRRTVHDVVADARRRFERVSALELRALLDEGAATVVDIRIPEDRVRHGVIDPSVSVPRTVLEWRVDPASGYSNPVFESFDQRLVVVCNEGYSSSLAAATLVDLGFGRATDLIGGMVAWLDAGLAVAPSPLDEEAYLGPPER